MRKLDLVGQRFGKLLVLTEKGVSNNSSRRQIVYKCLCDCGNTTFVRTQDLRSGNTKSCGCPKHGYIGEKKWMCGQGYVHVTLGNSEHRREHVLIAEKILGRRLKKGEVVHHTNNTRYDNRHCNLLICTQAYHAWLHHRMGELYMQEHFK